MLVQCKASLILFKVKSVRIEIFFCSVNHSYLPKDFTLGSITEKYVNTIKKLSTNSTEKICHEDRASCAKLTPSAP